MTIRCASTWLLVLLFVCPVLTATADEGETTDGRTDATPKERAAELILAMKDKKGEVRAKAALAAVELQHESLVSPLLRLLSDVELGVREAAMRALAARTDRKAKKRAAAALNPRIARFSRKRSDQYELMVVIECLQQLAQVSSVKPLLDGIQWDDDPDVAQARVFAVGYVPHAEAVERLIQFLDKGRRGHATQRGWARKALMNVTGVKHNQNPDQWRAWWRENKKTFDFEALAAARAEEAARKAEQEAERARKKEEQRKKREERRRKKKDPPAPAPDGGQGDEGD